jgi:hypothetical protein
MAKEKKQIAQENSELVMLTEKIAELKAQAKEIKEKGSFLGAYKKLRKESYRIFSELKNKRGMTAEQKERQEQARKSAIIDLCNEISDSMSNDN